MNKLIKCLDALIKSTDLIIDKNKKKWLDNNFLFFFEVLYLNLKKNNTEFIDKKVFKFQKLLIQLNLNLINYESKLI
jgi:hypothetical protein